MTTYAVPTVTVRPTRWYRRLAVPSALAGIGYAASWIVGLSMSPASADPTATGREVVRQYAGHTGAAAAQYVFTEGLPAIGLAIVALAVGRAAAGRTIGRLTTVTGLAAGALSLVMCALGLRLALWDVPRGDTGAAGSLFETISRVDGVKMALLGTVAALGVGLAGRGLPRWLAYLGVPVAVTMIGTAIGWLFLLSGPAALAWVSLPLLLVWTTAAGITVALGRPSTFNAEG